jgi:hypothetical protein
MSPLAIVQASFDSLMRKFPTREFIKKCTLENTLTVWVIAQCVGYASIVFTGNPISPQFVLTTIVISGAYLASIVFAGGYILNKYATEKFSNTEVLSLDVTLTAASSILFGLVTIAQVFGGFTTAMVLSVLSLVFAIYVLLTIQSGISQIAAITKTQAAYVILAPIVPIIIVTILMMSMPGTFELGDEIDFSEQSGVPTQEVTLPVINAEQQSGATPDAPAATQ